MKILRGAGAAVTALAIGSLLAVPAAAAELGTVDMVITNADTGVPVVAPCVTIRSNPEREACGSDGTVRVTNVPPGRWEYAVTGGASYFPIDGGRYLTLGSGELLRLPVGLMPGGAIRTTVEDAATGYPVGAICVHLVAPASGGQSERMRQTCSDGQGTLAIGPLSEPGTYQLYAWQSRNPSSPPPVLYGAQWVTASGGTGDQRQALTITVRSKQVVTIPPIKVDPAGTLRGVIRDATTGATVSGVCAYPYAFHPGQGITSGQHCSDAQGQYTIGDLGPYRWPVEYVPPASTGYAWQWSGDVADRFSATLTPVSPGATATRDARLAAGGVLTGKVTRGTQAAGSGYVWTHNARTGDIASPSYATIGLDGTFTLRGHRTQDVYVHYLSESDCWYGRVRSGSRRPAAAVPVRVSAGATTTLAMDLVSTCAKQPHTPVSQPVKPPPAR